MITNLLYHDKNGNKQPITDYLKQVVNNMITNYNIEVSTPEFDNLLDTITKEFFIKFDSYRKVAKLKLDVKSRKVAFRNVSAYIKSIKSVILCVLKLHVEKSDSGVFIKRNSKYYTKGKPLAEKEFLYNVLMPVLDILDDLGYIQMTVGYSFDNKKSGDCTCLPNYYSTDKLTTLFENTTLPKLIVPIEYNKPLKSSIKPAVILRDNMKNDVVFLKRADIVKPIIEFVKQYNKFMKKTKVSFVIHGFQWKNKTIRLHRVFNNSSWYQGGRFYGSYQSENNKNNERKHMLIDGQETIEIDFSCLHPRMLYNLEGENPTNDLYDIGRKEDRGFYKTFFQIMLNNRSEGKARNALHQYFFKNKSINNPFIQLFGDDWKQIIINKFETEHKTIRGYFFRGYGSILQNLDSKIMENILKELMNKKIFAIPFHDSVVVQKQHQQALEIIMKNEYHNQMGFNPVLK